MKKVLLLITYLIFTGAVFGQFHDDPPPPKDKKHFDRIAQLEKIKLLEALDLDEEQVLKLFSRRDKHQEEQRLILEKRDQLIEELDNKYIVGGNEISDAEFQEVMKNLAGYEKTLAEQREEYINSLSDILSQSDIVKYIVFESKFRQMVRKILMEDRGKKPRGK